jgi:hypothetical protein
VAKTLTNGSWTVSNAAGIAQAVYAAQTFTFTGPLTTNLTIYGYFVVDNNGTGNLVWAQLLDVPVQPNQNTDALTITPTYQRSYGTPTT